MQAFAVDNFWVYNQVYNSQKIYQMGICMQKPDMQANLLLCQEIVDPNFKGTNADK